MGSKMSEVWFNAGRGSTEATRSFSIWSTEIEQIPRKGKWVDYFCDLWFWALVNKIIACFKIWTRPFQYLDLRKDVFSYVSGKWFCLFLAQLSIQALLRSYLWLYYSHIHYLPFFSSAWVPNFQAFSTMETTNGFPLLYSRPRNFHFFPLSVTNLCRIPGFYRIVKILFFIWEPGSQQSGFPDSSPISCHEKKKRVLVGFFSKIIFN